MPMRCRFEPRPAAMGGQTSLANHDPLMHLTTEDLADALDRVGHAQALIDAVSPKALERLAELGLILRGSYGRPQLTAVGELFFDRLTAGEPIPSLDELPVPKSLSALKIGP
jgi:hypothetical protein